MYRFEWSALCERPLLRHVATAAGVADADAIEPLVPLIARALETAGGVPVVERMPRGEDATTFARDILHDAVRHALAAMTPPPAPPGHVLRPSELAGVDALATAVERVAVNRASAEALARAARIAPTLAQAIVAERRARGAFTSLDDLDRRMRGVTVRNREKIAGVVRIDGPGDRLGAGAAITHDFASDLRTLVDLQPGATPIEKLAAALEAVVVRAAGAPHPDTRGGYRRRGLAPPADDDGMTEVEWTGVLFGEAYYEALRAMLGRAKRSIDVCMFHIAGASEKHPTRQLLDALVRARGRGVRIRVLMDRDRAKDPYLSTIINADAKALLKQGRVPVRSDTEERLLHSKFVVLDRQTVVLGSHNWSAGSYFDFDDLSLVLRSPALATELTRRFTRLWGEAS